MPRNTLMKKTLACMAALVILLSAVPAGALVDIAFSHPELGEVIVVGYNHGMPYFSIYGYVYYEMVDPTEPYRGLYVNGPDVTSAEQPSLEEALRLLFADIGESVEGLYVGVLEDFGDRLSALPVDRRIEAVGILNGFGGQEGFERLSELPGFEEADVWPLSETYAEYYVTVGKEEYPYRVLSFQMLDEEGERFVERHCFLRIGETWRLSRITREYTDDYQSRTHYVHGVPGSDPQALAEVNEEALGEVGWDWSVEQVSKAEKARLEGNAVTVEDVILYRLPATLKYIFNSKGVMQKRHFALQGEEAYYSAFISLYMRYSDPVTFTRTGKATWSTNDLMIVLNFSRENPSIDFLPL